MAVTVYRKGFFSTVTVTAMSFLKQIPPYYRHNTAMYRYKMTVHGGNLKLISRNSEHFRMHQARLKYIPELKKVEDTWVRQGIYEAISGSGSGKPLYNRLPYNDYRVG